MNSADFVTLDKLLRRYSKQPNICELQNRLDNLKAAIEAVDSESAIQLYHEAIPLIEASIWSEGIDALSTKLYQQLFQELEQHISNRDHDERHNFIITIPIADRPQHLSSCLSSLLLLCEKFNYGGNENSYYNKITVLVADDSKDISNIQQHQIIAKHFSQQGLATIYFGLKEQQQQIDLLDKQDRDKLSHVLGNIDRSAFYHKGASIMRNITYLKLNEFVKDKNKTLFYFIDSDQEFKVKINTDNGDLDIYAVNFFYYLDRIFTNPRTQILTGKVVGDPPVSPSVMAGNFLEDVIGFLNQMTQLEPKAPCTLHQHFHQKNDDASYHDMADLFGFKPAAETYHYNCTLSGDHNHARCFTDFAHKLNHFFDGEHPTRKTYYEHEDVNSNIKTARTIYTGNYIFRADALKYFIPFATLKLRMAGPVLGRIIKSELGEQFVSANLPMLHKRTVESLGQSEFRPGISRDTDCIDLSGEFERQFFGDVMLFTIEQLTEHGYPQQMPAQAFTEQTLQQVAHRLHQKYSDKHQLILEKLARLKTVFNEPTSWWNQSTAPEEANKHINHFIHNIEYNFGDQSPAYNLINSKEHMQQHLDAVLHAIMTYPDDRATWQQVLSMTH